jgi:hypothetical protein
MLLLRELHALCRRRVMLSIMSLLPSYTHKKKKKFKGAFTGCTS